MRQELIYKFVKMGGLTLRQFIIVKQFIDLVTVGVADCNKFALDADTVSIDLRYMLEVDYVGLVYPHKNRYAG